MSRSAALFALVVIGAVVSVNGKPPSRIRGGEDAAHPDDHPWLVGIVNGPKLAPDCGGAIITPRHILTAAHCVDGESPNNLVIRSGFIKIRDRNAVVRHVSKYYSHPDYQPQTGENNVFNDLAVLVLTRDLPTGNSSIKTVSLPSKAPPSEQTGVFAGWGDLHKKRFNRIPMTLQTTAIKMMNAENCSTAINAVVQPEFICGFINDGNALPGDSGGPLVVDGEVIGIMSSGVGIRNSVDLFANVYHYLDWIKSKIE